MTKASRSQEASKSRNCELQSAVECCGRPASGLICVWHLASNSGLEQMMPLEVLTVFLPPPNINGKIADNMTVRHSNKINDLALHSSASRLAEDLLKTTRFGMLMAPEWSRLHSPQHNMLQTVHGMMKLSHLDL